MPDSNNSNSSDATPAQSLPQVLDDELHALERLLAGGRPVTAQTVHKLRLRCKRLRALLWLLPEGEAAARANHVLADLARQFSATRDARVLCDLATDLAQRCDPPLKRRSRVMRWLRHNAKQAEAATPATLNAAAGSFTGNASMQPLPLEEIRPVDVTAKLREGRARIACAAEEARREPTRRHFHDWRKVTKRYVLQQRLLGLDPPVGQPGWRDWRHLGEALGDLHDLDVLIHNLRHAPSRVRAARSTRRLLAAARTERDRQRTNVVRRYNSLSS